MQSISAHKLDCCSKVRKYDRESSVVRTRSEGRGRFGSILAAGYPRTRRQRFGVRKSESLSDPFISQLWRDEEDSPKISQLTAKKASSGISISTLLVKSKGDSVNYFSRFMDVVYRGIG